MMLAEGLRMAEVRLELGPHPERARRDAEALLLHLLGENRAWLLTHRDELLNADDSAHYLQLVERRAVGEPIQYIVGEAEFYGRPFRVTPSVLIPRPETEHLIESALEVARNFSGLRIVDVGAGSGAIAVTLAAELPQAAVTTVDLSAQALAVAKANAALNQVDDRVRFLLGDLLAPVRDERFELIVSNPPYIPTTDRPTLAVEVRDHEPELALFAGEDGLEVYRRLIPQAYAALVAGGWLLLEIGYGQSEPIAELLAAAGFASIQFVADLQGIARVALAQRPAEVCQAAL